MKSNSFLVLAFIALCAAAIYMNSRGGSDTPPAPAQKQGGDAGGSEAKAPEPPKAGELAILFSSSDGKKEWVEDVTKDFNGRGFKVGDKVVKVTLKHMRSGESMQNVLAGKEKPVIWSPVSRSWFDLINQTWQTRHGKAFVEESRPTVRTALVIAMWEPMARALGWPDRPVGWEEIVKVALDPKGWGSYGHPEWGQFKFGHSHPDYSTSAMLSLISLVYAETGKRDGLTADDMKNPKVIEAMGAIQRAIVHYGESSSWLTEKICSRGPSYLSAVTLYESSVVKANLKFTKKAFPLVAIYPKEGTFWENHPAGIVNADWVGDPEREAAKLYLDFITAPEQQAKTSKGGFRPADSRVAPTSPVDREHGADPAASDANALATVNEDVFQRANALWHQTKKKATIFMVIDTSGSMNGEPMNAARRGAEQFLKRMEPEDEVQVITFSTGVTPLGPLGKVREIGEPMVEKVRGLFAGGNTALYDACNTALDQVERVRAARSEPRLYGVVLLTDGVDTSSRTPRLDLMARLPKGEDTESTKIFTIAYGNEEVDVDFLKTLSDRSNAVSVKGDPNNIEKIYLSLASYF